MNRPTFDHTVNVLVQAYLRDELAHSFCCACAVGNIVAAAIGTKPKALKEGEAEFDCWTFDNGEHATWYDMVSSAIPTESAIKQINTTGYDVHELRMIERAFEHAEGRPDKSGIWRGKQTDPTWMFNGLMAVVDVLAEIHGIDLKQREEAKLLFVK